ncbi:unnamed protein product [Ixodes persulcatus]
MATMAVCLRAAVLALVVALVSTLPVDNLDSSSELRNLRRRRQVQTLVQDEGVKTMKGGSSVSLGTVEPLGGTKTVVTRYGSGGSGLGGSSVLLNRDDVTSDLTDRFSGGTKTVTRYTSRRQGARGRGYLQGGRGYRHRFNEGSYLGSDGAYDELYGGRHGGTIKRYRSRTPSGGERITEVRTNVEPRISETSEVKTVQVSRVEEPEPAEKSVKTVTVTSRQPEQQSQAAETKTVTVTDVRQAQPATAEVTVKKIMTVNRPAQPAVIQSVTVTKSEPEQPVTSDIAVSRITKVEPEQPTRTEVTLHKVTSTQAVQPSVESKRVTVTTVQPEQPFKTEVTVNKVTEGQPEEPKTTSVIVVKKEPEVPSTTTVKNVKVTSGQQPSNTEVNAISVSKTGPEGTTTYGPQFFVTRNGHPAYQFGYGLRHTPHGTGYPFWGDAGVPSGFFGVPLRSFFGGPIGSPFGGPFRSPFGGTFGSPFGGPFRSPFGGPFNSPLGGPFSSPYGGLFSSPFSGPFGSPFGGLLGGPFSGPFRIPFGRPFGYFPGSYPGGKSLFRHLLKILPGASSRGLSPLTGGEPLNGFFGSPYGLTGGFPVGGVYIGILYRKKPFRLGGPKGISLGGTSQGLQSLYERLPSRLKVVALAFGSPGHLPHGTYRLIGAGIGPGGPITTPSTTGTLLEGAPTRPSGVSRTTATVTTVPPGVSRTTTAVVARVRGTPQVGPRSRVSYGLGDNDDFLGGLGGNHGPRYITGSGGGRRSRLFFTSAGGRRLLRLGERPYSDRYGGGYGYRGLEGGYPLRRLLGGSGTNGGVSNGPYRSGGGSTTSTTKQTFHVVSQSQPPTASEVSTLKTTPVAEGQVHVI